MTQPHFTSGQSHPDFSAPAPHSTPDTPWRNAGQFMTRQIADILREQPDQPVVRLALPEGKTIWIIQDAHAWTELARGDLDRGADHGFSRHVFGNVVFTEDYGTPEHREKSKLLSDRLKQRTIDSMTPHIADFARETVERIAQADILADTPVDMHEQVLAYLLTLGSRMMTNQQIDLSAHAHTFQTSIQTMADTVASPWRASVASRSEWLSGGLLSRGARHARQQLYPIALQLIAASQEQPDSVVAAILRRHDVDAASIDETTMYSSQLRQVMDDVTMEFASTSFTTAGLVMQTLKHLIDRPEAMQELRGLLAIDFPNGIQDAGRLCNTPSMRKLFLTFLENLPVNVGAREATHAISFKDGQGATHAIARGDTVLFNLPVIQRKCLADMQALMDAAPPQALISSFLNPHANRGKLPMFFGGPTICPGRFAAIVEALAFVGTLVSRCDLGWPDTGSPAVVHGPVNRLQRPCVVVQPVQPWAQPTGPLDPRPTTGCPVMTRSQTTLDAQLRQATPVVPASHPAAVQAQPPDTAALYGGPTRSAVLRLN